MRAPRLRLPLVLLALLATGLAVFTGLRLSGEDRRRVEAEWRRLAQAPLEGHARGLGALLTDRVGPLLALTDDLPDTPVDLRARLRKGVWFRHALVTDPAGRIVFPPANARSAAEAEFLERARPAWSRGLTAEAPPDANTANTADAPARSWQWRTWYWGPGLHLGFLRALPDGRHVLVELDRSRLLADVMERLPADAAEEPASRLVDEAGRDLYVWGAPESSPAAESLDVPLPAPLANWHLRRAVTLPADAGARFGLWAGIAAALAAFIGGLLFIHRESARTVREAMQRVTFVNQVSHELKTPLTNIRMYAEMLDEELDLSPDDPARRHLGVVIAESQRLSRLIANILTFARSQRQHLTLHRTPTVPDALVRQVVEGFAPALQARGLEVALDLQAPSPRDLDPDAVGQILGNLIGNVEKYAAAGQWLAVSARVEDTRVIFRVSDRGPGIPAAARERVFAPFERLDDRLTEGVSGTGIGLTIARELARLHGGDVCLLPSETGACFEVTLMGAAA